MGLRQARERSIIKHQFQREQVVQLTSQGLPALNIARLCNIPVAAVRRCLAESYARGAIVSQARRDRLIQEPRPEHPNAHARVAAELRTAGYSYDEIAQHLGIPVSTVFPLIREELHRSMQHEVDDIEMSRALSLNRLDEALNGVMPGVVEGNARAIETMLKIEQQRAKLLGLDAPIRVDIEAQVRAQAVAMGLDPESAVLAAMEIMKEARA